MITKVIEVKLLKKDPNHKTYLFCANIVLNSCQCHKFERLLHGFGSWKPFDNRPYINKDNNDPYASADNSIRVYWCPKNDISI